MEKYLKIHWSIKLILGIIQFILILGICIAIYSLMFYSEIQNTFNILDGRLTDIKSLNILYPISNIIIGIVGMIFIYKLFQYKRWAILAVFVFIGLPLCVLAVGLIGEISYEIFISGIEIVIQDSLFVFIFFILLISFIFIFFSIKLIQLYKNIKDNNAKLLRTTKPRFLYLFLVSISPLILLGGLIISLYNPVIPLEVPEGYFKIEGFDLENPTYTDPEICKNLFDGINLLDEKIRNVGKEDISSGVILGKRAIFSQSDMMIKFQNIKGKGVGDIILKKSITEIQKERPEEYKLIIKKQKEEEQTRTELKVHAKNHPDQWKKDIITLRSQLTNESVRKLQELTDSLPQKINCFTRDDKNIRSEFFPSLIKYLKLSRIYDAAIQLAIIENDREKAINIFKSFHDFNTKYYSSNINLAKGIIGNTIIVREFGSIESLARESGKEGIEKIREIYKTRFNTQENRLNAWKGEYYFFEHILTGRGKSIKELSIPYLFNGDDMFNRGVILIYAGVIADINNDTIMKQKILENRNLNYKNFSTIERVFLENGDLPGLINKILGRFYNPIGKILIEAYIPSFGGYNQRYRDFDHYQDYIRYDLLGIKDEIQTN